MKPAVGVCACKGTAPDKASLAWSEKWKSRSPAFTIVLTPALSMVLDVLEGLAAYRDAAC